MSDFFSNYKDLYDANPKSYRKFLEGATDVVSHVVLYLTIALVLTLVIWAIVIRNRDEQYLASTRKTMLGIVVGYSVGVLAVLGAFRLYAEVLAQHITWHFWLIVGLFALLAIGIVVVSALHKRQNRAYKWVALGFALAVLAYSIVVICVVKPTDADYAPKSNWLMYLLSAILVATIVLLALFGSKSSDYNTKSITYAAICIAASFALSYVKFFSMPQGGSVTFASMLPLALYSFMFGTRKGVVAGVVYGLLQFVQSPQFYQPMQALLDYPIAFSAIGLAGIGRGMNWFSKMSDRHGQKTILQFAFGTTIAILLRYFAHVMSGYFVFYTWAQWAGYSSALAYTFAYNSYTLVDLAIVLALGILALSTRALRRIVLGAAQPLAQETVQ